MARHAWFKSLLQNLPSTIPASKTFALSAVSVQICEVKEDTKDYCYMSFLQTDAEEGVEFFLFSGTLTKVNNNLDKSVVFNIGFTRQVKGDITYSTLKDINFFDSDMIKSETVNKILLEHPMISSMLDIVRKTALEVSSIYFKSY